MNISNLDIFNVWLKSNKQLQNVVDYVLQIFRTPYLSDEAKSVLKTCLMLIEKKWKDSNRHQERFCKDNAEWLKRSEKFSKFFE